MTRASISGRTGTRFANFRRSTSALVFASAVALSASGVFAQTTERSGKEIVEASCASCHADGKNGAPKIGDKNAWSKRAEKGLSSLTQTALKGIRSMPAHGGSPALTDLEIKRAITYMVNQSGGKWVEPAGKTSRASERTGEQIVKARCVKCHESGAGGAPRIGDRDAWIPRLKDGMDSAVRSAIKGHGGMPARGGLADLTDAEVRNAITYLYRGPGATK